MANIKRLKWDLKEGRERGERENRQLGNSEFSFSFL